MTPTEIVGWALVHSLWIGVVVAGLLFLLLKLVDERRAALRYGASCVALLILVVAPVGAALRMQPGRADHAEKSFDSQPEGFEWSASSPASPSPSIQQSTDPKADIQPETGEQRSSRDDIKTVDQQVTIENEDTASLLALRLRPLFPWIVLLWVLGVIILSARLVATWVRVQRVRKVGTSAVSDSHLAALNRILHQLAISRPVQLLQSTLVQVPAVIGWLRPVVLIPVTLLNGLTVAQLEAILAHELAHIRRHDYVINLFQVVIETLLFYHPASWWVSRQVRETREHCCDDLAVQVAGNPADYARALLALEEQRVLALLPAANGGDLLSRVRRLVAPKVTHAETFPRWVAALVGIATVAVLGGGSRLAAGNPAAAPFTEPAVQIPNFSTRNAPVSADTVIKHPDPSAPLAQRWQWARDLGATNRYKAFWIGYAIAPMPAIKGSVFISRLERRGILGAGGLDLRGRITNFGNFDNFSIPGVMLQPLVGGPLDDVALLFAFVVDQSGKPVLARIHISSLSLPVDLEDRPVLWLGSASDEQSIPLVLSLYQDAPAKLKEDMVAAVGIHGADRLAVPPLIRWLTGDEPISTRTEAAEWLARHPDPEALRVLARAARNDRSGDVRREAAESVSEMGLDQASDTLIVLARTLEDSDARQEAVEGLAERDDARSLAAAGRIAREDRSKDVRREAVETLGEFSNAAGLPDLLAIIKSDPSSDIRQEAVETIAETAEPDEAIRILTEVVRTEREDNVLHEAVETIGDIESPKAVAVLHDMARSNASSAVRMEAVETLGQVESGPEVAEFLFEIAMKDADEDVQREAVETLGELQEPDALERVARIAREHSRTSVRVEAVETLGESMEPEAALKILKSLSRSDRSTEVQVEAVETMGELPDEIGVPALIEVARDHGNPEVRAEAVETLGEQGDDRRAVEALTEIAHTDRDQRVGAEALETLSEVGSPAALAVIIQVATKHPDLEMRREAIETLGELESTPDVLNTLTAIAMSDPSVELEEQALEALGELDDDLGIPAVIRAAQSHPNRDLRKKALEILSESDSPTAQAMIDSILH